MSRPGSRAESIGKTDECSLIYFGKEPVTRRSFSLPRAELKDGLRFRAEIIDTWNMTLTEVDQMFEVEALNRYTYVDKSRAAIELPGRPYMALRIRKAQRKATQKTAVPI